MIDASELFRMIGAAGEPPAAPLVQPENDLNPKPSFLAFQIRLLEQRVATLEKLFGAPRVDVFGRVPTLTPQAQEFVKSFADQFGNGDIRHDNGSSSDGG